MGGEGGGVTEDQWDLLLDRIPDAPEPPLGPLAIWRRMPEPRPGIVDVIEELRRWADYGLDGGFGLKLTFVNGAARYAYVFEQEAT